VRQVGYLQRLYRDGRSTENKIFVRFQPNLDVLDRFS